MTESISRSESETLAIAASFAASLKPGDAVALRGPLGAGKTLFARGVARALGHAGPVSSPSYALVHEYEGRIPIFHMDLYRLKEMGPGSDWEEIGLNHYLDGRGICLVEWPERLPPDYRGVGAGTGLGRGLFTHEVTLEILDEAVRKVTLGP